MVMYADHAQYMKDGKDLSLQERIRRACLVPMLFSFDDYRRFNAIMEPRGFHPVWGESSYASERPAWEQLRLGMILNSSKIVYSTNHGRYYTVEITRLPDVAGETWKLKYNHNVIAAGDDVKSLLFALNKRKSLSIRT